MRVVGLPLHCWSGELFKRIGDCCGGFVEVDEETKNFSQLQWAGILVKNRGNFFPGTLHLVVKSLCYAVQLWWEVLPWISAVVPMKNMKWNEGEKVREEWDVGSRAGSSSGRGKKSWRAAETDGAGAVKKIRGEEQSDDDRIEASADGFAGYGKEAGGVGLSEQDRLG